MKIKNLLMIFGFAAVIFLILLTIEKSELSKYERIDMAVAVTDIPQGTKLTKENINTYFEVRKVDNTLETEHSIRILSDLKGYYVGKNIYKNELVYDYDFVSSNFENINIQNKVRVSFKVESITDAMSGMLRMGDVVRLYVITSTEGSCLELVNYEVIIEEAFDANGALIQAGDNMTSATNFNISIDKNNEASFYEIMNLGKVKAVLVGSDEAAKITQTLNESQDDANVVTQSEEFLPVEEDSEETKEIRLEIEPKK